MNIRSLVISSVVAVGAAGGGAVVANTGAFDDRTDRDPAGTIVESGGLGAFAVQVGDCVRLPDEFDDDATATFEVTSVEGVPCDRPHDAQAYAIFDLEGVTTYNSALINERSQRMCVGRWHTAIGTDYLTDRVRDVLLLMPTEQSWSLLDDRSVTCLVVPIGDSPLIGSQLVEG